MALVPPTTESLAAFMNVESNSLTQFAAVVLWQASDLWIMATENEEQPVGTAFQLRMYERGVLAMAEILYLTKGTKSVIHQSPFSGETIGSYSYQLATRNIANGIPTGVDWFDYAVNMFRPIPLTASTSIHCFDGQQDHMLAETTGGQRFLLGPGDWCRTSWNPD